MPIHMSSKSLPLTETQQMDADLPSSSLKRRADRPLTSSSADKRNKTMLPDERLTTLCSTMDMTKKSRNWLTWLDQAEADNSRWLDLISDVLVRLTMELAITNTKDSVTLNLDAEATVKNLDERELEGWKVGVCNGIKRNDWIDLLARPQIASLLVPKPDEQLLPPEPKAVEEASSGLPQSLSDHFTPGQHKIRDEKVTQVASEILNETWEKLREFDCAFLLKCVIENSDDKLEEAYKETAEAVKLLRLNPKLLSAVKEAWRMQDYREIRESALLAKRKPYKDEPIAQREATENAWITDYRGEAPAALWAQIKKAMTQVNRYARYLAIVQSSGTGKSRMIDEFSKKHFVISINLRGSYETGYPPPDKRVRRYLCGTDSQRDACIHSIAFLTALFTETSKIISNLQTGDMEYVQIVDLFNKYMSEGMNFESHGVNRCSFYNVVVLGAIQLEQGIEKAFAMEKDFDDQLASAGICVAFKTLIATLSSLPSNPVNVATKRTEPLVILAFDEARTLSELHKDGWSCFSELRRALRALNEQLLFSLFLTTTGNVDALVPSSSKDPSQRIQGKDLSVSHPFGEVGFDHFAIKNQFDLKKVTDDLHLSHFGRPLWATRYDKGSESVKSDIIKFAASKLLTGNSHLAKFSEAEKLACLAQRLPIEFHSVTYASKVDELKLVEGHMRILLRLDPGFESLTTVSASEPLLSEAAYSMMYPDSTFKAAETLTSCLAGYAIHKGDRGELLVMLLFILARDRAVGPPGGDGRPSGGRWCLVRHFMNALFKSPSPPQTFAKSKIFFNHWVKVHQHAMVNVRYLAQLMRRGAALLCGTNQAGIDGIIPFLLEGSTIFIENIGAIVFQVKNDEKFQDTPKPKLFEAMDPYALGILNKGDKIPIIRIVFALASKIPCFKQVECEEDFESYDFWVGGISSEVFLPVQGCDAIWAALLQATYGWEDIYKTHPSSILTRRLRRSMNPGAADNKAHWENWADFKALNNSKKNGDEDEEDDGLDEEEERVDEGLDEGLEEEERVDEDVLMQY